MCVLLVPSLHKLNPALEHFLQGFVVTFVLVLLELADEIGQFLLGLVLDCELVLVEEEEDKLQNGRNVAGVA